jgi:glutamate/tyrosine decarboxylase-like PLP-dependent enzyme
MHQRLLNLALDLALAHLDAAPTRHVGATASRAALMEALGGPLPDQGADEAAILVALAQDCAPGLVATVGPRYFGFVTGGAWPVSVAADWLAAAWDQNGALYVMSPAVAVLEDIVQRWIVDLLGLPPASSVGYVTGCHMANFTCLAAARHEVLRRAGWNVEADGLQRAPRLRVIVGEQAHVSVVGALRMLGVGASELEVVPADEEGRMIPEAAEAALASADRPTILCVQAGNVNSGASDPVAALVDIARPRGAWVHVDGAFGLWAAAVPELRHQLRGIERADSWATDAHKWLNVPYDSGLAIVADAAPHRASMSLQASYLVRGEDEERVGMDWVPESSRRARVLPIYAVLRALGRHGVAALVRRHVQLAQRLAGVLGSAPGVRVLNQVVLNQVVVQFTGAAGCSDDDMTRAVIARVQAEGTCWVGGARWREREVMRVSIANWSTTDEDIDRSAEAILRAYDALGGAAGLQAP